MGMLALAEELSNVSRACRRVASAAATSMTSRRPTRSTGATAWPPRSSGGRAWPTRRRPSSRRRSSRSPGAIRRSATRLSDQPKLIGLPISPSTVRCVWVRHGLTLRYHRLLWLEQKTAAEGGVLTEAQMKLLRRFQGRESDPERHIESPQPLRALPRHQPHRAGSPQRGHAHVSRRNGAAAALTFSIPDPLGRPRREE